MRDKLNRLDKEDLVDILERIYDVHQKDVEHYTGKEDIQNKLLYNIHQTRVERINNYVDSALQRKKEKANEQQS